MNKAHFNKGCFNIMATNTRNSSKLWVATNFSSLARTNDGSQLTRISTTCSNVDTSIHFKLSLELPVEIHQTMATNGSLTVLRESNQLSQVQDLGNKKNLRKYIVQMYRPVLETIVLSIKSLWASVV